MAKLIKCGIYGIDITPSEYNKNGRCACLGCVDWDCQHCSEYTAWLNSCDMRAKCLLCQKNSKVR